MKVKIFALIALFPIIFVSGCSTCEPRTEYVDRVVYLSPEIPTVKDTELPSVELKVWGDYKIYKQQCQAKIKLCNDDKKSILTVISNSDKQQ